MRLRRLVSPVEAFLVKAQEYDGRLWRGDSESLCQDGPLQGDEAQLVFEDPSCLCEVGRDACFYIYESSYEHLL